MRRRFHVDRCAPFTCFRQVIDSMIGHLSADETAEFVAHMRRIQEILMRSENRHESSSYPRIPHIPAGFETRNQLYFFEMSGNGLNRTTGHENGSIFAGHLNAVTLQILNSERISYEHLQRRQCLGRIARSPEA